VSTTPAAGGGPGGRPDWLARKYSRQPAQPGLAAWADDALDQIYGIWHRPVTIGPYRDADAARAAKNALYDATYKRWNRAHPDEPLSLSANVTDPADGRCYARGQERCTQNGCRPTPGGYYIHARLYDKAAGRAHQGAKDRESWDYDPLAPGPRRPRATTATAADPGTGRRFGAGRAAPAASDPAPVSRFGARLPSRPGKPGQARDVKPRGGEPAQEGILARLRRTLG
jgi:hypothetical protein